MGVCKGFQYIQRDLIPYLYVNKHEKKYVILPNYFFLLLIVTSIFSSALRCLFDSVTNPFIDKEEPPKDHKRKEGGNLSK
jgi:hypothetical protein